MATSGKENTEMKEEDERVVLQCYLMEGKQYQEALNEYQALCQQILMAFSIYSQHRSGQEGPKDKQELENVAGLIEKLEVARKKLQEKSSQKGIIDGGNGKVIDELNEEKQMLESRFAALQGHYQKLLEAAKKQKQYI